MPNEDIERRKARMRDFFSEEFLPGADNGGMVGSPDMRQANALEYIAHQAGKMREDISAIREYLKKMSDSA